MHSYNLRIDQAYHPIENALYWYFFIRKAGYDDYANWHSVLKLTMWQENRDSLLTHCDTRESVQSAKCTLSSAKIDNAARAFDLMTMLLN